jgi:hypothetical protein
LFTAIHGARVAREDEIGLVTADRIPDDEFRFLTGDELWRYGAVEEPTATRGQPLGGDVAGDAIGDDAGMGKTPIAAVLVVCLTGCSFLFVEKLPGNYDRSTPPRCTTSKGAVVLDGVFLTLNTIQVIAAIKIEEDTGQDMSAYVIGGLVEGLIFGISGLAGESWVDNCRKEVANYDASTAQREIERAPTPRRDDRGFYCTTSPVDTAIGACNREMQMCERSQQRLVDAGHDVGPCVPATGAMCFAVLMSGKRQIGCAPTVRACERQREWAIDKGPTEVSACRNGTDNLATVPTPERDVQPEPPPTPTLRICFTVADADPACFTSIEECERERAQHGDGAGDACVAR